VKFNPPCFHAYCLLCTESLFSHWARNDISYLYLSTCSPAVLILVLDTQYPFLYWHPIEILNWSILPKSCHNNDTNHKYLDDTTQTTMVPPLRWSLYEDDEKDETSRNDNTSTSHSTRIICHEGSPVNMMTVSYHNDGMMNDWASKVHLWYNQHYYYESRNKEKMESLPNIMFHLMYTSGGDDGSYK
jgi:hypothetical protein